MVVLLWDWKVNHFFSSTLGFNTHWDYENYKEYISRKIANLSTIKKIQLKCDVINGSLLIVIREPILFNFVLDKPAGYEVYYELETIHCKKKQINLSWIL